MNLHRVEGKSDWADVAPSRRNPWQRVAEATRGVLTVGNVFSLIGLLSVPVGLAEVVGRHGYLAGAVILVLGRACDLFDGMLADATGTKSPLGEKIDATFDKISIVSTVAVFAVADLIPRWVLLAMILPHAVAAVIAVVAYVRRRQLHPSRLGKLSMAAAWACLVAFICIHAFSGQANRGIALSVSTVAYVLAVISIVMSAVAAGLYVREYVLSRRADAAR